MPVLTSEERIGTTLAEKYRIDRILGEGGWGVVFAGVHTWTGREVAIKLLHGEHARKADVVRRFLQEAKAAARLKHPNVVDVLDMGREDDHTVYLVLELLRGRSLRRRLDENSRLSVAEALNIVIPVLRALAEAHEQQIIHRDLKPDNIFLAEERGEIVPKLLDFGIAKSAEGGTATVTGTVMGTPHYMSPEQVQAAVVTTASDVWSMGVVLYECLTGRLPFNGPSIASVLLSVLTDRPPPLASLCPEASERLAGAIHRALERDPTARHANARALLADVLEAVGPHVERPTRPDATGPAVWGESVEPSTNDGLEPVPSATPQPSADDSVERALTPQPSVGDALEPPATPQSRAGDTLALAGLAVLASTSTPAGVAPLDPASTPLPVFDAPPDDVPRRPLVSRTMLAGIAATAALFLIAGGAVLAASGPSGESVAEETPSASPDTPATEPGSAAAVAAPEPAPRVEHPPEVQPPPAIPVANTSTDHAAAPDTEPEPTPEPAPEPSAPEHHRRASHTPGPAQSTPPAPHAERLVPSSPPAREAIPAPIRGTNGAPIIE